MRESIPTSAPKSIWPATIVAHCGENGPETTHARPIVDHGQSRGGAIRVRDRKSAGAGPIRHRPAVQLQTPGVLIQAFIVVIMVVSATNVPSGGMLDALRNFIRIGISEWDGSPG